MERRSYFILYIVLPCILLLFILGLGCYAYNKQTSLLKYGVETHGKVLRFQQEKASYT